MAYWGNRDQKSDAPLFTANTSTGDSGQDQFGNTVYGVSATEAAVADKGIAPGWVKVARGTGRLALVEIDDGGADYDNADTFSITATTGANAEGDITTDGNGTITAVSITNYGGLFASTSPTVVIDTANGAGATLTATVTGRAGRVTYETLVALNTVVGDATNFANTSSANVANSTGSADDAVFPDS